MTSNPFPKNREEYNLKKYLFEGEIINLENPLFRVVFVDQPNFEDYVKAKMEKVEYLLKEGQIKEPQEDSKTTKKQHK